MRAKLGLLLMEDEKGEVSVQLFADPGAAGEIFRQLSDTKRLRATFVALDWEARQVRAEAKELPESMEGERMECWKVGQGPIFSVKPFGIQVAGGDTCSDEGLSKPNKEQGK